MSPPGSFSDSEQYKTWSAIGLQSGHQTRTRTGNAPHKGTDSPHCRVQRSLRGRVKPATSWCQRLRLPMSVTQLRFVEAHCNCLRGIAVAPSRQGTTQPFSRGSRRKPPQFYATDKLSAADQRNALPSIHIRCIITANFRATATAAFFIPLGLAIRRPHALSADHFPVRVSRVVAASKRYARTSLSPHREMPPLWSRSPDW